MWLCIISYRQFEDTFKNAQLRKVKKTQPHRILSCKQLKMLLKNQSSKTLHQSKLAIWGEIWGEKSNKYDLCDFASIQADNMRRHLKTHSGEKSNNCDQCDFASIQADNMRRHFKKHDWEISNKCAHININYVNNTFYKLQNVHFLRFSNIHVVKFPTT